MQNSMGKQLRAGNGCETIKPPQTNEVDVMKAQFFTPKLVALIALAALAQFAPIDWLTAIKDAFGDFVVTNL